MPRFVLPMAGLVALATIALQSEAVYAENVIFKSDLIAIYESENGSKIATKPKSEFPATAVNLSGNNNTGRLKLDFGPPIGVVWVLERHVALEGGAKRNIQCDTLASAAGTNAPRAASETLACKKSK